MTHAGQGRGVYTNVFVRGLITISLLLRCLLNVIVITTRIYISVRSVRVV
jgi:hypothetical protein